MNLKVSNVARQVEVVLALMECHHLVRNSRPTSGTYCPITCVTRTPMDSQPHVWPAIPLA